MPAIFPAASKAGGQYFAMPDVCFVPAPPPVVQVPVPFPNMAQVASTDGAVDKVLIENKETVVEGSKVPNSSGDEAGTKGGVVSGKNMDQVQPKAFSTKVFAKGKKVVMLTSMSAHNGSSPNIPAGMMVAPSQAKVIISP
ncbi:MAG: DUF4150 domain-containing protein [Minicystis sp.]